MSKPGNSRQGPFDYFLRTVEWLGNLLPHPVTLFAIICVLILVASGVAGALDLQVVDPRPEGTRTQDGVIRAVSLINPEGFRRIGMNLVTNFTSFAPLGTVLVAMLGVGVAEKSGLLGAVIRAMVLGAPRNLLTAVVVFAAVISNTASEMGYVVSDPSGRGRVPFSGAESFGGPGRRVCRSLGWILGQHPDRHGGPAAFRDHHRGSNID